MDAMLIILAICFGVIILCGVLYQVFKFLIPLIKNKDWATLLTSMMKYIIQAERIFTDGASRKQWVLKMLKETCVDVGCTYDEKMLSEWIDIIIRVTKNVNVHK